MTENDLLTAIAEELTTELGATQPTISSNVIEIKVKDAYRKVKKRRCYEYTSYSSNRIIQDLNDNYFQDIKDVALFNISQIGGYFETSHSENSISRVWRTEDAILGNIVAFVKIL